MNEGYLKVFNGYLQFLIVFFTLSLVWFAFSFYPKEIKKLQPSGISTQSIVNQVAAGGNKFPIETEAFRVVYEQKSNIYYVFVQGQTVSQYKENKIAAQLSLKNALSAETLCGYEIIWSAVNKINVPKTQGC